MASNFEYEFSAHSELRKVLQTIVDQDNGGHEFHVWAALVDRDGVVRRVLFSGGDRGDQFPGARAIALQRANAANAFSLPNFAISTANLYSAAQPGASLYGLLSGNPVSTSVVFGGDAESYGTDRDPVIGKKVGGVDVSGGGLALYSSTGDIVGGLGISGDDSCTDHIIAWKVRHELGLNAVPAGKSSTNDDNMIFDIVNGASEGGWGHPKCGAKTTEIINGLPNQYPTTANKTSAMSSRNIQDVLTDTLDMPTIYTTP